MLVERSCPHCQGSGLIMVETSSLLGLIKKQIPSNCENCSGTGRVFEMPVCNFCDGQGLVGNESEICRACNGTGRVDSFSFIPRDKLQPGLNFTRRCSKCASQTMEIQSGIETRKLTKSWEREEELRSVELVEQVRVACPVCGDSYAIPVYDTMHKELEPTEVAQLERMGMNLSFIYEH